MTLVSGTMVFIVLWWVILFAVLPFGVRPEENPKKGFATSAPQNPQLKKKFLATTVLTAIIWSLIQWIMVNHWVHFS